MKIMQNSMERQFLLHQEEYEKKAIEVLRSGWYILGNEVTMFESEFASYIGSNFCVGLANGLDALILAFRALGIGAGDEVIIQANAYIACVMGVTINGATPIFVDSDSRFQIDVSKIEEKITKKTKAILAVHLFGMVCDMSSLVDIAKKHNLYVVEDCAQSHGTKFNEKMTGTFGDIACFSFYPSKGLGAFGDSGAITTGNEELANKIRILRNYGSEKRYYNKYIGMNSRLDELQAGLLRIKLKYLDDFNLERHTICGRYLSEITNLKITLPTIYENSFVTWHQFVIQCDQREALIKYLNNMGISTIIHYPIPPHLSEAYQYLGHHENDFPLTEKQSELVLSLPLFNGMKTEEIDYIINAINLF